MRPIKKLIFIRSIKKLIFIRPIKKINFHASNKKNLNICAVHFLATIY